MPRIPLGSLSEKEKLTGPRSAFQPRDPNQSAGVRCPRCQQMFVVCVSVYFVGNQATVDTCACKQCHQLLRVEASWSSGGGGGYRQRYKGCELTWGREPGEAAEVVVRLKECGGGEWSAIKADRWDRQWGSGTHPACQQPPVPFRLPLFYIYKLRVDPRRTVLRFFATRTLNTSHPPSSLFPNLIKPGGRENAIGPDRRGCHLLF